MSAQPFSNKTAGFTLIETLAAVSVLIVALLAAMMLFGVSMANANLVKNNYIASGLAQEGLEVARNLRDSDWHESRSFGSFGRLGGPVSDGSYRIEWNSPQLLPFDDTAFLKRDHNNGMYGYTFGLDTIFKRRLAIQTISAVEKRVTVTITWNQKGSDKTLSAESHLFNWK